MLFITIRMRSRGTYLHRNMAPLTVGLIELRVAVTHMPPELLNDGLLSKVCLQAPIRPACLVNYNSALTPRSLSQESISNLGHMAWIHSKLLSVCIFDVDR